MDPLLKQFIEREVHDYINGLHEELKKEVFDYAGTLVGPPGEKGQDGLTVHGRDGRTPTKEELLALIAPLIKPGKDGRTPTITELKAIIEPLIPTPIPGKNGKDITEVAAEALWEKIKPILDKYLDKVRPRVLGRASGGGGGFLQKITVTGTVNGVNASFTLDKPYTSLFLFWNGQLQEETTHYTRSGATITFVAGQIPTSGTLHGMGQP